LVCRGDLGEIWGRSGGDLGEIWRRSGGDLGRYRGDTREIIQLAHLLGRACPGDLLPERGSLLANHGAQELLGVPPREAAGGFHLLQHLVRVRVRVRVRVGVKVWGRG